MKKTLQRIAVLFAAIAALPFVPVPGTGLINEWIISFGHYVLLLLALSSAVLLWSPFFRRPILNRMLGFGVVVVGLEYGLLIRPFLFPQNPSETLPDQCPHQLSILYANVLTENSDHETLRKQIAETGADVVMLVEVNQQWIADLDLANTHPYAIALPRADNFGLGIFSRWPLAKRELDLGLEVPVIAADVSPPGVSPIALFLLHAFPPASSDAHRVNRLYLRRIAGSVHLDTDTSVVAGDFNATPFSSSFEVFSKGAWMHHVFEGGHWYSTWNARFPLFLLPIDHVFYRGALRVEEAKTLPDIGSDHWPIFTRFSTCAPVNTH